MLVTRFDPFREIKALEQRLFDRGYSDTGDSVISGFTPALSSLHITSNNF